MRPRVKRFLRRQPRRSLLVAGLFAALVAVWLSWQTDPRERFRDITGRDLPPGVRATAYANATTDNLFHTTHYWLLTGSPTELNRVTEGTGFEESLEDARWAVPDMRRLFDVPLSREDVVAGFEWEQDRDRWFCILGDGTTAVYAH
jgi:hypothetical protein